MVNGALVGLVSSWEDGANVNGAAVIMNQDTESLSAQMPYVQGDRPPTSSMRFGIALIRSVSLPGLWFQKQWRCRDARSYAGLALTQELPIWGMLDHTAGGDEEEWKNGVAGDGCRIRKWVKAKVPVRSEDA